MISNSILNLQNFDLSIFRKNLSIYFYIYNTNYCCFLKINKTNKIKIRSNKIIEIYNQKQYKINNFKSFIRQFAVCETSKIKFTGKGYKIKKNSKKSLILLFNRSHITTIWWRNIFIKKLKKYKIYIKCNTVNKRIIETIINVRPVNIFTKKGLRLSRQVLLKKKGKK